MYNGQCVLSFHAKVQIMPFSSLPRSTCFSGLMWLLMSPTCGVVAQQADADVQPAPQAVRDELTTVLNQLMAGAERVTMGGRMGSAGDTLPDVINLCRAARFLPTVPAAERYEMLRDWVLPSTPGALARNAMCFSPVAFPPEIFFSPVLLAPPIIATSEPVASGVGSDGVISLVELLIAAAAEAGKLEELSTAAEQGARTVKSLGPCTCSLTSLCDGPREHRHRSTRLVIDCRRRSPPQATSQPDSGPPI